MGSAEPVPMCRGAGTIVGVTDDGVLKGEAAYDREYGSTGVWEYGREGGSTRGSTRERELTEYGREYRRVREGGSTGVREGEWVGVREYGREGVREGVRERVWEGVREGVQEGVKEIEYGRENGGR